MVVAGARAAHAPREAVAGYLFFIEKPAATIALLEAFLAGGEAGGPGGASA